MEIAEVFRNEGRQAVRLPESFQINENEVFVVSHIGGIIMLMPKDNPWQAMMDSLSLFTDDFLKDGIEDLPVQERESL